MKSMLIYLHAYMYIYTYIYIWRERERERETTSTLGVVTKRRRRHWRTIAVANNKICRSHEQHQLSAPSRTPPQHVIVYI